MEYLKAKNDIVKVFEHCLNDKGYTTQDFVKEIAIILFIATACKININEIKIFSFPQSDLEELKSCEDTYKKLNTIIDFIIKNNEQYKDFFLNLELEKIQNYDILFKKLFSIFDKVNILALFEDCWFGEMYSSFLSNGTRKTLQAFYTPKAVSKLMSLMLYDPTNKYEDVFDCCCGAGNIILQRLFVELEYNKKSTSIYWCNDIDFNALAYCVFSLIICGAKGVFWRKGDGLDNYTSRDFKGLVYYNKTEMLEKIIYKANKIKKEEE